jgi:hypothetical protein
MTAQEVYEAALALMDEISDDGEIDAESSYAGKAPRLIDILHRDLALCEGVTVTGSITSLGALLEISDDTAMRIMPYGLAAKFALADKDMELYNDYQMQYERLKRTIPATETNITDEYGVLDGMGTADEEF